MFQKFQDALLVLVFFYAIFRIGWGDGITLINLFILLCSVVALVSLVLKHTGYLEKVDEEKKKAIEEAEKKK